MILVAWGTSLWYAAETPIQNAVYTRIAEFWISGTLSQPQPLTGNWTGYLGFERGEVLIGIWDGGGLGPTQASIQEIDWSGFGFGWPHAELQFYRVVLHKTLPFWIPFLLIAIPTAILFYRDRPRPKPGHCPACRYNLTGNTSGVCPECGERVQCDAPPGPSSLESVT